MPVTNYVNANGRVRGHSVGGVRTDYLTDALGSVTATVDQTCAVRNTYRYKPYGTAAIKTGTDPDPRYLWTGDTGSRATGLSYAEQYNRARHYGSKQANWISVDPLWPDEPAYQYVNGNPTTWIDPSGLEPCPDIVNRIRDGLSVQLFKFTNTKKDARIINDCIQRAAKKGNIKCSPFTYRTGRCLVNNFPLVDCDYTGEGKCKGNYEFTPHAPLSPDQTGDGHVYHIVLCMESRSRNGRLFMCPSSGTNYLPHLQLRTNQAIWLTLLHEALHACAYHHGEDLAHPGYEPSADRTCNEIASCCINRHISGKALSDCTKYLPSFSSLGSRIER